MALTRADGLKGNLLFMPLIVNLLTTRQSHLLDKLVAILKNCPSESRCFTLPISLRNDTTLTQFFSCERSSD
jgi:hypothetical protein